MTPSRKTPTYAYTGAMLSACLLYRHSLERRWAEGETLAWLGHNPSTADGLTDDPTIRKEVGFSLRAGYGALVKVNAMDLRATDPRALRVEGAQPVSPWNGDAIAAACAGRDVVIATGTTHKSLMPFVVEAVSIASARARRVLVLQVNADGTGKHPLYVRGATGFSEYGRMDDRA